MATYVPAVLADVVEVGQLAVSNLLGVMLEERHPPDSVTCHNTGLHTHTALVDTEAESVLGGAGLPVYLVQLLPEPV